MTKEQITAILVEITKDNSPLNKLIKLEKVSSISTEGSHCIYPGRGYRFKFVTTNECNLVECYKGKEGENGFEPSNEFPEFIMTFDHLQSFTLTQPDHPFMPYLTGRSC